MQLTIESKKIWVASEPVDFRKSITGLSAIIIDQMSERLKQDIFVFYNRGRNKIKILGWHKNGFVLLQKHLHRSKFITSSSADGVITISPQQLSWLIAGLDWVNMSEWGELSFDDYY